MMIRHNLKIAFRNLLKYKVQMGISIIGLSVGFVCLSLSLLWIRYETSYDSFHKGVDRIYLAGSHDILKSDVFNYFSDCLLYDYLVKNCPEIEAACRIRPTKSSNKKLKYKDTEFQLSQIEVDSSSISMFNITVLDGNTPLHLNANQIAITERAARQIFGKESPIGKQLVFPEKQNEEKTIVAVVQSWEGPSLFPFDILLPFDEKSVYNVYTLFRVYPNSNIKALEKKLENIKVLKNGVEWPLSPLIVRLTELRDLHPDQNMNVKMNHIRMFASIGALVAPLTIPLLAKAWGWEMAFIVIGGLGFIWMGFWVFMYSKPSESKHVNKAELEYIEQDKHEEGAAPVVEEKDEKKMKFWQCFSYKQTWAFAFGKFMTDGVWWFFLFWTPSYLNTQFGIKTSEGLGIALIFTLYAITMLSIYGGKLPTIIINRTGLNPYAARMRAMLIFAFFPLVVLLAQPLGTISPWLPVIMIGIGGAAHQSWSANIFSTVSDMFPRAAIASITGIGGMAGGFGSMILQKVAGNLFVYSSGSTIVDGKEVEMTHDLLEQGAQFVRPAMEFMGFSGKPAGYFIIFCVCAVAYLIGWIVMKALVPKYKPIVLE